LRPSYFSIDAHRLWSRPLDEVRLERSGGGVVGTMG